ncbi:hypothetical protein D3C77_694150 [compost metagenome]
MVEPPEKYSSTLWMIRSKPSCTEYSSSVTGHGPRRRSAVPTQRTSDTPRVRLKASQGSCSSWVL